MRNRLIEGVEAASLRKNKLVFDIGDTVTVRVRIHEGAKERIQPFIGVVIARRGGGINESFTVRRIVADEGVERVFPVHSPHIVDVVVTRSGKTRRAKLYYLRDRVGKARKLREKRASKSTRQTAKRSDSKANKSSTSATSDTDAALAGV